MKKIQNIKEFNANNINNLFNVGKKSDVPEIINPFISGFKENNKKNYDVSFKKQKFNLPVEFFDLSDMVELVKKEKDVIDNEKTKKYSVDSLGNVTLLESNPVLVEKMNKLKRMCEEEGINIKITETVRSVERQDELYAKGRTVEGYIVTNAKGEDYSSMHQWGIAFDVCINEVGDAYNIEKLKKVGEIGKSLGLEWGGDWKDFQDMPHFQLAGYSIEELKMKYNDPGVFSEKW